MHLPAMTRVSASDGHQRVIDEEDDEVRRVISPPLRTGMAASARQRRRGCWNSKSDDDRLSSRLRA